MGTDAGLTSRTARFWSAVGGVLSIKPSKLSTRPLAPDSATMRSASKSTLGRGISATRHVGQGHIGVKRSLTFAEDLTFTYFRQLVATSTSTPARVSYQYAPFVRTSQCAPVSHHRGPLRLSSLPVLESTSINGQVELLSKYFRILKGALLDSKKNPQHTFEGKSTQDEKSDFVYVAIGRIIFDFEALG